MAKYTLKIEDDFDFVLIGISSHEKEYRVCWALNNSLELALNKSESLEVKGKKQETSAFFSLFQHIDEDNFREYYVLTNRSENKSAENQTADLFGNAGTNENELLIPELKQINYFLVIKGELEEEEIQKIVEQIKKIEWIQAAVNIDVSTLKSKQNLIF